MKPVMTKIAAVLALTVAATGAHAQTVSNVGNMTVQDLGTVWTGGTAHVAVNSGIGSHTAGTSGGTFYFRDSLFSDTGGLTPAVVADGANSQAGFTSGGDATTQFALSWGSTGLGIINGTNQTSFGGSFDFGGAFTPNSNDCAGGTCVTGTPTGSVVGGNLFATIDTGAVTATNLAGLTIDLGDFAGFYDPVNENFRLNPNGATPLIGNAVVRTSAMGGVSNSLAAHQFYYSLDWSSTIQSSTGDASNGSPDPFNGFTVDWHLEGIGSLAPIPEASTYGMMLAGLGLIAWRTRRQ
jgi:hypothetical protein